MVQLNHITLSPIDHLLPRNYVKSALYLPLKPGVSTEEAFHVLQEGLHRTFLQFPWLNGKVHWQSKDAPDYRAGQLEIRYSTPGIDGPRPYQLKFKELDTDVTFEELKESEFPLDTFEDEELLWADFLPSLDNGAEVFVGQANFIDGACIISAAIFHSVTDGMGSAMLPKLWSDNCKGLSHVDLATAAAMVPLPVECTDRSLMSQIIAKEGNERPLDQIDPKTWELLDLSPEDQSDPAEDDRKGGPRTSPEKAMRANTFYISSKGWDTLWDLSTDAEHQGKISRSDALYAFLWRSLMRARAAANPDSITAETRSHLELAIDLRPDFSSEGNLPAMYLGNCLLHNVVSLPVSNLVAEKDDAPLSSIAAGIRDAGARFTPQGIQDAYTLLNKAADYRKMKLRFTYTEGCDTMISSMLMFPIDQIAFGDSAFRNGGRPTTMRPLMGGFNRYFRMCFLLPKLASGGVEFVISLYEDEMDKLMEDEEFGKYASFCS